LKTLLKTLNTPESLIKYVQDRPGHDRRYAIDASKAHQELGWKPLVGFERGLKETVDWYLSHREWLNHVTSGEYKNFYSRWYNDR
jgi:dTDP-glucose 4,6-dehydratase